LFLGKKRKSLGLAPVTDSNKYFTANSTTLLAINETLAPPCPTWEQRYNFKYTGYCFDNVQNGLPDKLTEFIENGDAPVYIGFGSVHIKNPDKFTDIAIEAALKTGRVQVLLLLP
jgi:UDP:flavonoid glycosyltransferase YjiC (YdhE family)